jgi:hypothetical protein
VLSSTRTVRVMLMSSMLSLPHLHKKHNRSERKTAHRRTEPCV